MFQQNSCSILLKVEHLLLLWILLHLRILNNLCFKPLEEDIDAVNNVEAKAKKIYERALQSWL
jgi:hypothetical protein